MKQVSHFTTRRGLIAASGFGGLSLYGLWAAYGAAPTPLPLLGLYKQHASIHFEEPVATMEKDKHHRALSENENGTEATSIDTKEKMACREQMIRPAL